MNPVARAGGFGQRQVVWDEAIAGEDIGFEAIERCSCITEPTEREF